MSGSISGTTAAIISAVSTAVSVGVSAYSAVSAGEAQAEAAEYNAKVAEQQGQMAREKAAYDEELHRNNVRRMIEQQRALYGKSGVDMTGSPLLTLEESAGQGELDALAIRYGGDVEQAKARSSANLSRMQGQQARTAGYLSAGTTLLSGAASAASPFIKASPSSSVSSSAFSGAKSASAHSYGG